MLFCGLDRVPCYNHGTCKLDPTFNEFFEYYSDEPIYFNLMLENNLFIMEGCQCSQENGLAKYHGESCEMPGSDECAESPCQNGGSCTTIIKGETQACFIKNIKTTTKIMLKLEKVFECSCIDGYTGVFCEFKIEQDHLLFVHKKTTLVFNSDGRLIAENAVFDEQAAADRSCSTMLNGEAIIFGGGDSNTNIKRQVHFNIMSISLEYHPF